MLLVLMKSPVVQMDDYYAYGLTLNSYFRENSIGQNNLYQGKELQWDLDLNLYDFHARQYDPTIGRTLTIDPHADNYLDLSPFSWVGNNPIITLDPDGMDFVIARYKDLDDETKKTYTRGEYREMRQEGKQAIRNLTRESQTAKAMIKDLEKSDNVHTVTFNKDSHGSQQQTDRETGNSQIAVSVTERTEGENMTQEANTTAVAGHEIAHAWRDEQGLDPKAAPFQDALKDLTTYFKNEDTRKGAVEYGGTHIENMIRSELEYPLRLKYNNGKGGTYYDLNNVNYDYNQTHDVHKNHNVKPIRRRRKI
jgi:RHS repeat-associated protein